MAHAKYLTYEEYTSYGGTATNAAFLPLEFKARKRIDYQTATRIQAMKEVPEAVKLCMFSLINILGAADAEAQVSNPTVTSYNTDGYSESYGNALSAETSSKEADKLIKSALYGELDDEGVPLLYRGVSGY